MFASIFENHFPCHGISIIAYLMSKSKVSYCDHDCFITHALLFLTLQSQILNNDILTLLHINHSKEKYSSSVNLLPAN